MTILTQLMTIVMLKIKNNTDFCRTQEDTIDTSI